MEQKEKEEREREQREKEEEDKENELPKVAGKKNTKILAPTHRKLLQLHQDQYEKVFLEVGGTKFVTCQRTLKSVPSLLSKMLLKNSPMAPVDGCYSLDRDPVSFGHFLTFLRTGDIFVHQLQDLLALKQEAKYFECERLIAMVEKRLKDGK